MFPKLVLVDTDVTTEVSDSESEAKDDTAGLENVVTSTSFKGPYRNESNDLFMQLRNFKLEDKRCSRCKFEFVCVHLVKENYENVVRFRNLVRANLRKRIVADGRNHPPSCLDMSRKLPKEIRSTFMVVQTTGDGNCFFNSISISLIGDETLAATLRKCCTFEYLHKREYYDKWLHKWLPPDASKATGAILNRLKTDHAYQGEDSAFVLSNTIGRRINWIQEIEINGKQDILKESYFPLLADPRASPIFLYFAERHFSAVLPNDMLTSMSVNWPTNGDIRVDNFEFDIFPGEIIEIENKTHFIKSSSNPPSISSDLSRKPVNTSSAKNKTGSDSVLFKRCHAIILNNISTQLKQIAISDSEEDMKLKLTPCDFKRSNLISILKKASGKNEVKSKVQAQYLGLRRFLAKDDVVNSVNTLLKSNSCTSYVSRWFNDMITKLIASAGSTLKSMEPKPEKVNCIEEGEAEIVEQIDCTQLDSQRIRDIITDVYQLTKQELAYEPPKEFQISISAKDVPQFFNFETDELLAGSWANIVQKSFYKAGVPCAFIGTSGSYLYKDPAFYRGVYGKCGCGLKFHLILAKKPRLHRDVIIFVKTFGIFKLVQKNPCCRPITSFERKKISEVLSGKKAHSVFLTNLHHLNGLRALHCNLPQRTSGVLRKIKSEAKTKLTKSLSLSEQVLDIQKMYEETVFKLTLLPGFIHQASLGSVIKIHTYDYGSLRFHLDQLNTRHQVTFIHLDATGGVFKNPDGKQLLIYSVMGKGNADVSYPIGEMISQTGSNVVISDFLATLHYNMKKIQPQFSKPLADVAVTDFSFAMINGMSKGINREELMDYIKRSYAFLVGNVIQWDPSKAVLFICTAHLINAVKKHLVKIIPQSSERKMISEMALLAMSRLQECFTIDEFRRVSNDVIQLFQHKSLSSATIEDLKTKFRQKKVSVIRKVDELCLDVDKIKPSVIEPNEEDCSALHKLSPFYKEFKVLRDKELCFTNGTLSDIISNPFYLPKFLDYLQNIKIPWFPLWGAAVVYQSKLEGFLRETNAVIESHFGVLKNTLKISDTTSSYADYLRSVYPYHDGQVKAAIEKSFRAPETSKKVQKRNRKGNDNDMDTEKWKKTAKPKNKTHNTSFYFSQKCSMKVKDPYPDNELELDDENSTISMTAAATIPEKVSIFYEENESDLVLFKGMSGAVLTKQQFLVLLKKEWLEFAQIEAYCDYLRLRLPKNMQVLNTMAIYKIGNNWDGLLLNPNNDERLQIIPGSSFYFMPVLHINHWFLVLFKVNERKAQLFDSGFAACCNLLEIKKNVVDVFLKEMGISTTLWITEEYPITPKQTDGINCGVHLIANLISLIENPDCPLFVSELTNERFKYARTLLNSNDLGKGIMSRCENSWLKLIEIIEDL